MEYQLVKCYSIGTNHTISTNEQVECTCTQPEAIGNILSPQNEMHFTNGISTAQVPFHWTRFVCIAQPSTFQLWTVF